MQAESSITTRHPFTISSAPSDPYVSVHIRQAGDFTKELGERLGCTSILASQLTSAAKKGVDAEKRKTAIGQGDISENAGFTDVTALGGSLPSLRIDGPFGAPAEDVFNAEVAVLIGTGIGGSLAI